MPKGQGSAALRAPVTAPAWVHSFVREIEAWAEAQKRGPLPLSVYAVAALPDAADYPFALIGLSDGVSHKHVAISDGLAWYYMDGTAV